MNVRPVVFGALTVLAGLLCLQDQASAKQHKKFKLERNVNVGYPQDELPNKIFTNGAFNPCYFLTGQKGAGAGRILNNTIHHGAAAEPTIAVNPTNSNNIVAAWQQDRIRGGSSLEIGIAFTFDGGKTWERTEVPFAICNGGIGSRVSDPWLSVSNEGTFYLGALQTNAPFIPSTPNQTSMVVTLSKNGGQCWSTPISVYGSSRNAPGNNPDSSALFAFPDKNSITADPNHDKNAYITFDVFDPEDSFSGPAYVSRTTDGGETWTPAKISYVTFPDLCASGLSNCDPNFLADFTGVPGDYGSQTIDNIIAVLPKANCNDKRWQNDKWPNKAQRFSGDLLDYALRIYASPDATPEEYFDDLGPVTYFFSRDDLVVVRSQDQGSNWNSTATIVVPYTDFEGNFDPSLGFRPALIFPKVFTGGYTYDANGNPDNVQHGADVRASGNTPPFAVNATNGFLYAGYQTGQFRSDFLPQIGLTVSRDGGHTWSERVMVNRTPQNAPNPQAFTPNVAINSEGYVAIMYCDFRNDPVPLPNESSETLTDTWLAIYKEVCGPGSTGIGLDFVQEIRLSEESYIMQNGPTTSGGIMTNGDYAGLVTDGVNFYAVRTQSHNGPFTPVQTFSDGLGTTIPVDDNYRQSPYVSIIKPIQDKHNHSKHKLKHK